MSRYLNPNALSVCRVPGGHFGYPNAEAATIAGVDSTQCSRLEEQKRNKVSYRFELNGVNLFIATARNVKRWLRMLAEAQIGSKSQRLPFSKSIQWIPRFFRTIRLSLNLLPRSSQVALFLAHA